MSPDLTDFARALRQTSTDAERLLWKHLKAKRLIGYKFRRQEPIGRFIVDFVCFEKGLIVDAAGGQHALDGDMSKDHERTQWLESQGFTVLRFWNNDILTNIDGVMEMVMDALSGGHPSPRPTRGEGA